MNAIRFGTVTLKRLEPSEDRNIMYLTISPDEAANYPALFELAPGKGDEFAFDRWTNKPPVDVWRDNERFVTTTIEQQMDILKLINTVQLPPSDTWNTITVNGRPYESGGKINFLAAFSLVKTMLVGSLAPPIMRSFGILN
jgi:hypothetical protein